MGRFSLLFYLIFLVSTPFAFADQTQIVVRTEHPMGAGSTQQFTLQQVNSQSPKTSAISTRLNAAGVSRLTKISATERSASLVFADSRRQEPCQRGGFTNVYTMSVDEDKVDSTVADLSDMDGVCYAEPLIELKLSLLPDDFSFQGGAQPQLTAFGLPDAWDFSTGNSDIVIAVIDTGVNVDHEDLRNIIWQNPGESVPESFKSDGIDNDGNGFIDDYQGWDFITSAIASSLGVVESAKEDYGNADNYPNDADGHGTHVSGIAAAETNNDIGIAGVAFNARIMPLRVGGVKVPQFTGDDTSFLSTLAIAQAIEYAALNGAHIINMSFGGLGFSSLIDDAITLARDNNVLPIAAAGNGDAFGNGFSISNNPNDANFMTPASMEGVIAVGSLNQQGTSLSSFSNFGPALDVSGPGENIFSTFVRFSTLGTPSAVSVNSGTDFFESLSGTSMASPYVAGVAALVWSFEAAETGTAIDDIDAEDIGIILSNSSSSSTAPLKPIDALGQISPGVIGETDDDAPLAFGPEGLTGDVLAYPNPLDLRSNSQTLICYNLTAVADVSIRIYSLHKTLVKEIIRNDDLAAYHEVPWDARDEDGDIVPNGVYYIVFEAKNATDKTTKTHKIAVYR